MNLKIVCTDAKREDEKEREVGIVGDGGRRANTSLKKTRTRRPAHTLIYNAQVQGPKKYIAQEIRE